MLKVTTRLIFCVLLATTIIVTAAFLRFYQLDERPLHFDEATGARIVGYDLEEKRPFDPKHFHGPLLSTLSVPVVLLSGQEDWLSLTITPLRTVTAAAGLLTVMLCLFFPIAWPVRLAAAAMTATSGFLVYYSRMYIHEPLFVLTGALSLLAISHFARTRHWGWATLCGVGIGLMASTRETVIFALFAWVTAAAVWWYLCRPDLPPLKRWHELIQLRWSILAGSFCALTVIFIFYTHAGKHPYGFIDFFRTFLVYETIAGHEKPWNYYLDLLVLPHRSLGMIWTEVAVVVLGFAGYFLTTGNYTKQFCRFCTHSGLLLFLIFSVIPYKTPWLMSLAWLHLCIAAGFGAVALWSVSRGFSRAIAALFLLCCILWQGKQAHHAALRWPNDARNPYAYVPTSNDIVSMTRWIKSLMESYPELAEKPHVVIGSGYWPLPWYLRNLGQTAYFANADQIKDLGATPLIFTTQHIPQQTRITHQWIPRGLRHEVPLWLGIRKDLWEKYQQE